MDKNMEHEIETGLIEWFIGLGFLDPLCAPEVTTLKSLSLYWAPHSWLLAFGS